jgi:Zn-dependent protease with chaperone function
MIIAIIILSPIYIRFILSAKNMQDKVLLRTIVETGHFAGIRNPRVYVWNTHQLLMNAFAIGVFFTPKTIILTDKLIKNLTQSELLAVVRHEFAHHRYWHLPFLFLSMICALIWSDYLLNLLQIDSGSGYVQFAQLLLMMIVFVVMSKQFERQADAYAVVDYSKKIGSSVVTEDALQSMKTALSAIAYSNNISMDRNDLLHGSIHERQLNLGAIVGCPLDKIPINRKVRVIKIATILFLLLGIVI